MVCLETNRDHSIVFETELKYCIFVVYEGYSISSMGFLPMVVDIMAIINSPIPVHFSSLSPKMFTLAISCLTTSNLPWFMDLTSQVPVRYCSLQHQILLAPPDTSTTGRCFYLGPATSFFLELLIIALRFSPVAYWTPPNLGGSSFSVLSFCLFILWWGSHSSNTGVVCLYFNGD